MSEAHTLRNADSAGDLRAARPSARARDAALPQPRCPEGADRLRGARGHLRGRPRLRRPPGRLLGSALPGRAAARVRRGLCRPRRRAPCWRAASTPERSACACARLSAAPAPRSARLGEARPVSEDGRAWREQNAGRVAPGERVELEAPLPPAVRSDALALREAQLWLELDDAALEVDDPAPADRRAGDAARLGLGRAAALPGAAARSRGAALLEPDARAGSRAPTPPDGSPCAARFPPASRSSRSATTCRRRTAQLALALRFPLEVPLLSVFATDTGVGVQTRPPASTPQLPQPGPRLPALRGLRGRRGRERRARARAPLAAAPAAAARSRGLRGAAGGLRAGLPDRAAALRGRRACLGLAAGSRRRGGARVGARGAARSRGGLRDRQARGCRPRADARASCARARRAAGGRARAASPAAPVAPPSPARCPSCARRGRAGRALLLELRRPPRAASAEPAAG